MHDFSANQLHQADGYNEFAWANDYVRLQHYATFLDSRERSERMNRHAFVGFSVILLLAIALLALPKFQISFLHIGVVYASDSYGDDINDTIVSQYNTTAWITIQDFTANGSARITPAWSTSFLVTVKINASLLATNSSAGSDSGTRVNMTIVQADNGTNIIWNNLTLNSTGTPSFTSPYWYVQKLGNWTSNLAVSGVTYNCTIVYQGYY